MAAGCVSSTSAATPRMWRYESEDRSRPRPVSPIIRGKIKQNLRKYISQGEMIAKKGKDTVAIPLPSVDIPHFKHGDKQQGGVGQGEGEPGDSLGQGEEQPGQGHEAGDR